MEGKIFSESYNLYQDQSRVLFDYYREAAERIVAEEERYEKEIAIEKERNVALHLQILKETKNRTLYIVLFFLIIPIILAFQTHAKIKALRKEFEASGQKIAEFQKLHDEIFRDYRITKMGVGYVPVAAQVPFEDKSFILDYTGSVETQDFNLQTLRQADLFTDSVNTLYDLIQKAPVIEGSEDPETVSTEDYSLSIQHVTYHDYLGRMDRALRTSTYCLSDLEVTQVSLPVIMPGGSYHRFLNEHATTQTGDAPVLPIYDSDQFRDEIERFHALNEMKRSLEKDKSHFEDVLRSLMVNMANSVQAITQVKIASANTLVDASNKLLLRILKSGYNHYSPHMEAEEIDRIRNEKFNYQDSIEGYTPFQLKQSSRLRFDPISDCWVAEDGSKTNFPFGVHQLYEEIVAPIVQNLMQETRIERMRIYNNIKDQKTSYLNQWHQETMDFYGRNRAESNDLINIMRSTLSEYISSYNAMVALKKTEDNLKASTSVDASLVEADENEAEVFAAFEAKSNDFKRVQEDFMEFMDRLKEDIDRRAEKFEYIEYYDASLRDSIFRDYASATSRVAELDERRSPLAEINPLFAESVELPPPPSVEDLTGEHLSLNLPVLARQALRELDGGRVEERASLSDEPGDSLSEEE